MPDPVFANPNQPADGPASLPLDFTTTSDMPVITLSQNETNNNSEIQDAFWFLQKFDEGYAPIHGYLSAIISVAGVFANLLTIVIMSRPDMRTPTNRLYAVMSFADLLTMVLYSIFAIFFQIALPDTNKENLTELRAIFMVIYADLSVFAHTLSVAILVAVTVFRVLILQLPGPSSKKHCSLNRANWTAVIALFSGVFVILPNVYVTSWRSQPVNGAIADYWEVYQREDKFSAATSVVNFWFQAILVKLLPCLLLTLASIAIVRTLREAEARRRRLQGDNNKQHVNNNGNNKNQLNGNNHTTAKNRTSDPRIRNRTLMLFALLVAFLLTEFPQGILTLVCGIMGDEVWSKIYMPLGNLLDMLTLINAGVNFVLFASMSSEFRLALNRQLSAWCACYARMLERKQQEKYLKRFGNGHIINAASNNNNPSSIVLPSKDIISEKADPSLISVNNVSSINNNSQLRLDNIMASSAITGEGLAITGDHQLLTASGMSVSLKSYLDSGNQSSAISTLILSDLDNLVDGELVIKKPKSSSATPERGLSKASQHSKRSLHSSRTTSNASISSSKSKQQEKIAAQPLISSKEEQLK